METVHIVAVAGGRTTPLRGIVTYSGEVISLLGNADISIPPRLF
jgi:hypothetical protein